MSKNRIKQRKNRRWGRYLRALYNCRTVSWQPLHLSDDGLRLTDECGKNDPTAFNAIRHSENEDWIYI